VSEERWLGLVIRSETDQPHEWPFIAWTIRNRLLSGRYGNSYEAVILSKKQFSHFNQFESLLGDHTRLMEAALNTYAGDMNGWRENDYDDAVACGADVMGAPRWRAPFGVDVMHYYSPVSMKPPGNRPPWLRSARRTFTPEGVDPSRFVFAAGVP